MSFLKKSGTRSDAEAALANEEDAVDAEKQIGGKWVSCEPLPFSLSREWCRWFPDVSQSHMMISHHPYTAAALISFLTQQDPGGCRRWIGRPRRHYMGRSVPHLLDSHTGSMGEDRFELNRGALLPLLVHLLPRATWNRCQGVNGMCGRGSLWR